MIKAINLPFSLLPSSLSSLIWLDWFKKKLFAPRAGQSGWACWGVCPDKAAATAQAVYNCGWRWGGVGGPTREHKLRTKKIKLVEVEEEKKAFLLTWVRVSRMVGRGEWILNWSNCGGCSKLIISSKFSGGSFSSSIS